MVVYHLEEIMLLPLLVSVEWVKERLCIVMITVALFFV
jgi:hypothetical protein